MYSSPLKMANFLRNFFPYMKSSLEDLFLLIAWARVVL